MRGGIVLVVVAVAAVAIGGDVTGQTDTFDEANSSQTRIRPDKPGHHDRYIVVFKKHIANPQSHANQIASQYGASLHFVYEHAIKGFAVSLPSQAASALSQNPNVDYVEPDPPAEVFTVQNPSPSWGLDRIDQVDLPLDNSFAYGNDASGFSGIPVNIYIIDSGVFAGHPDFGGRVQFVPNGSNGDFVGDGHGSADDCMGHGTHVAGITASNTHGVAKGVAIWAARVIDCIGFGTASMALAAVDWITANGRRPAVVNMSIGYPDVQSLHDAVQNSIDAGFVYVVAAGNRIVPQDACEITPANVSDALTVGATDPNDDESYFSNFGACVDVLAPGNGILSTAMTGGTEIRSGTSMATPHVAGTAATFLCSKPEATQSEVADSLLSSAAVDRINLTALSDSCDTPNLLLQNAWVGPCNPGPPNTPPIVAGALPDTTVDEDATVDYGGDLDVVFTDVEDGADLTFSLESNSNPSLVLATIDGADNTVDLTLVPNQYGVATIVVRATDSGYLFSPASFTEDIFVVTVTSVNDPPVVVNAIPDAMAFEDISLQNYRDLDAVFFDVDGGDVLTFLVPVNNNPSLVAVVLHPTAHTLDLNFTANQSGSATIVVRATDLEGAFVEDTFGITVTPVNDPPVAEFTSESGLPMVDFDASPSVDIDGSIVSYTWDFGDGSAGSGITVSHRYPAAGTYRAILTTTDDGGLAGVDSVNVDATPNTHDEEQNIFDDDGENNEPGDGGDAGFEYPVSPAIVEQPRLPSEYALRQNVPNPFNPTTTIYYDVPEGGGRVTLRIYDATGRIVQTLVDEFTTAGEKRVTWDARNREGAAVATGVYFYRLTAPGFRKTRKMILLR